MKKFVSVMLVLMMVLSVFAGCGSSSAPAETEGTMNLPGSALEILETIWADYANEEKFAIIGGNIEANIMDAPGNYDLAYAENMTYNLLVPADRIDEVAEAASMIHMMNANNFTCGVFRMAEGADAEAFASAMQQAVQSNPWICGFPETLHIATFGDAYVLVAFGVNDAMNPFTTHLAAVYPQAKTVVNEAIG